MTAKRYLVKSEIVKPLFYFQFRFFSVLVLFLCSGAPKNADADLLVRYPAGMEPSHIAEVVDALKDSLQIGVLSVAAQPDVPAAVSTPSPRLEEKLLAAEAAYKRLALEDAAVLTADLDAECLAAATFETCRKLMFDATLLRGMALFALERTDEAAAAFRTAHTVLPEKVLDPKQYSPNILRAFAAACAETESAPRAEIQLIGEPSDAQLFLDGTAVQGTTIRPAPGRHFIEADLPGFDRAHRILDVDADSSPKQVVLRPTPQGDVAAWTALTAAISDPKWTPTDPGMSYLLRRFRIDAVLMLDFKTDGGAPAVQLARAGFRDRQPLPVVNSIQGELPSDFDQALKEALGLAKPQLAVIPAAVPEGPAYDDGADDEDDADVLEDDDEEDSSIQFDASDDASGPPEKQKNILKSPWLWISIGMVAAIVTGVVVAVQVQD